MSFHLSEIEHNYGPGVHILDDPYLTTQLARLCSPETGQPTFNALIRALYTSMIRTVINHAFPRTDAAIDTRMKAFTERGTWTGRVVDRSTKTVVIDIARAGILPSQICYDTLNTVLDPAAVRQDHLIMARTIDADEQVTGASIAGSKIGGTVDDAFVMLPDPMGATGNSLATAIESYRQFGNPAKLMTLNLIITPQFIRRLKAASPDVAIYAVRLDRGLSPPDVLATAPGTHWDRENGLDERHYIVPGGGGFGELMNNSWI
jgi:uracil phosphoribosyltransferase